MLQSSGKDGIVYEYKFWALLGEELRFVPSSSLLLFYPRYVDASVTENACPPPITPFLARPGLFLKGKVTPAVANIRIRVLNEAKEVLIETLTAADGTYSAGPLYDDQKYEVTAELENYKFVPAEKEGDFLGRKLGQIKVTIVDQETNQPLSGVLVSLSGGDGYRSNALTPQSGDSTLSFQNLYPGSYHLRLALKEYSFIPATKSITVGEGQDVLAEFQAKRVAFSAFGSVKTLNDEPERSVTLEALGPNGEREESQSDALGNFRIRGLNPTVKGAKYVVRVKNHPESKVERASPLEIPITIGKQDVQGLNFLVFRKSSEASITGIVKVAQREWLDKMQVEIYDQEEQGEGSPSSDTPLKTIQLGPSNFFEFRGLAFGSSTASRKYLIRVKSNLSPDLWKFEDRQVVVEVKEEPNVHVEIEFSAEPHTTHQEITSTSFWALLLGIVPVLCSIYRKEVFEFAQKVAEGRAFERSASATSTPGGIDPDLLYHQRLYNKSKKPSKSGRK